MAKILVLCQHFYPEMVSTGLIITDLTVGLANSGSNDVTIFCSYPKKDFQSGNPLAGNEIYNKVHIHRAGHIGSEDGKIVRRLLNAITFLVRGFFFSLFRLKQTDLIIITTNPPFTGLIPLLLNKLFGKKYLLVIHDIYPEIAIKLELLKEKSLVTKLWAWMTLKIYRNASKIVVLGRDMEKLIQDKMGHPGDDKIEVIANWANPGEIRRIPVQQNRFIKDYGLENKTILLYSGNMGRTHNIEPILEAAGKMLANPELIFAFIGNGYKKKLVEAYIDKNPGKSNVLLLPYQPYEMLAHTLSAATACFVCLDEDFTGLSVPCKSYGIMAVGKPLIGLMEEHSEIGRTILENKMGIVWNRNSGQQLDQQLNMMLADRPLLEIYSNNALRAFFDQFELSIAIGKYNKVVNSILYPETKTPKASIQYI